MKTGAMNRNFGVVGGLSLLGIDVGAGINTDDATATADDVVAGKIAYAKGRKLVGTFQGKSWASGNGTVGTYGQIDVSGIGFLPGLIVVDSDIYYSETGVMERHRKMYMRNWSTDVNNCNFYHSSLYGAEGADTYPWTVTSGSFSTRLPAYLATRPFKWFAVEST